MTAAMIGEQRVGLGLVIACLVVLWCYYGLKALLWLCERADRRARVANALREFADSDAELRGDDEWLASLRPPSTTTRERVTYKPHHTRRAVEVQRRRDANKRARAARRVTRARG